MAEVIAQQNENESPLKSTLKENGEVKAVVEENGVAEKLTNGDAEVKMNGETNGHVTEEEPEDEKTKEEAAAAVETQDETEVEGEQVEVADAAAVEEAPVEPEVPVIPKVILHQFPPVKTLPSTSMFCLKLETFLRANSIPYENQYGYKAGKNGKVPWIEYDGERVADSSFIIDHLNQKFELDMDSNLSAREQSVARSLQVMVEENSYWAMQYYRWVEHFQEFKKLLQQNGTGLGFNVNIKMNQRKVRSGLDHQGMGRHPKAEIQAIALKDLAALSEILSENEFMLGETITTLDCSVFALVAQILYSGVESPLSEAINTDYANLSSYAERVREKVWPDWAEMVTSDSSDPGLKKGFSFRRKKNKKAKEVGEKSGDEGVTSGEEGAAVVVADETPADAADTPADATETATSPDIVETAEESNAVADTSDASAAETVVTPEISVEAPSNVENSPPPISSETSDLTASEE